MYYSFPAFARLTAVVRQTPELDDVTPEAAKPETAEPVRDEQSPAHATLPTQPRPLPVTAIE